MKCPFCKADYNVTDDQIVGYKGRLLECIHCHKTFYIDETIPALYEYLEVVNRKKEVEKLKNDLSERAKFIKAFNIKDDYDSGYDPEYEISSMKDDIQEAKYSLDEAKDDYSSQKNNRPKKSEVCSIYADMMIMLFDCGLLSNPLHEEDKERILRIIAQGNVDENSILDLLVAYGMQYSIMEILRPMCIKIVFDRYLPLPPHKFEGKGSGREMTPKQRERLQSFGIKDEMIDSLNFNDASWLITMIKNKEQEEENYDRPALPAKCEWMNLICDCNGRDELLDLAEQFYSGRTIIPPPAFQ